MPSLVVLDTNAWVSTRMLTSPEACEFLTHCRHTGRRILLPEIVEAELRAQYLKALTECAQEIASHNDTLIALIGRWNVLRVPTREEMQAAIDVRLLALDSHLERSELTVDHARDALSRTIERRPPASPNGEQFRDCLLWSALMSHSNPVVDLVTNDNIFFEKKETALHANLVREAAAAGKTVRVHRFLSGLLSSVADDPETKHVTLVAKAMVTAYAAGAVSGGAHRRGLRVISAKNHPKVQLFATEDPQRLMAEFTVTTPVESIGPLDAATVSTRGSVYLRLATIRELEDFKLDEPRILDEFTVRDSRGDVVSALSSQSVSVAAIDDGAVREHRVRRPITSDDSILRSLGLPETETSGE